MKEKVTSIYYLKVVKQQIKLLLFTHPLDLKRFFFFCKCMEQKEDFELLLFIG